MESYAAGRKVRRVHLHQHDWNLAASKAGITTR
jgi:hypothetical protein